MAARWRPGPAAHRRAKSGGGPAQHSPYAPVFLSTTQPNSSQPLRRLMLAQDTGSAIKGGVRGDFYWGFGAEAGAQAGGCVRRARCGCSSARSGAALKSKPGRAPGADLKSLGQN